VPGTEIISLVKKLYCLSPMDVFPTTYYSTNKKATIDTYTKKEAAA
jgi:hypothetical protein